MKLLMIVNVDWFFLSHRLPVAIAAKDAGWDVHIATTITDKAEVLESYGFTVHPIEMDRTNSNPLGLLRLAAAIYRTVRKIGPDVTHLVTIKPVLIGGVAARIARANSVVYAFSGLGHVFSAAGRLTSIRREAIIRLYRISLGASSRRLIFQNPSDLAEITRACRIPPSDCVLIPGSGVDMQQLVPTPFCVNEFRFVMAARLLKTKGVMEFCQAATVLSRENSDLQFWLVGDLDESNPASLTEQELSDIRSAGIVKVLGHRDDVPSIMGEANVVVLPSYYAEGLPKVLIEAAAMGRAVITTNTPGCRAAIEEGVTGVLVEPRSVDGLVTSMRELAENPSVAEAFGLAGRERAEGLFRIEDVIDTHLSIYADLAGSAK